MTKLATATQTTGEAVGREEKGPRTEPLGRYWRIYGWTLASAAAFHLAYARPQAGFLVSIYLFGLLQLARTGTWRQAFYSGLTVGLLIAAVWLGFFWRIFGGGAIALWLVYGFWVGLFVALARLCINSGPFLGGPLGVDHCRRFGWTWLLIPFIWCGLEYFRSELYYLRFSWLSAGLAFPPPHLPLHEIGTYGAGFLLTGIAVGGIWGWPSSKVGAGAVLFLGLAVLRVWASVAQPAAHGQVTASVPIAGIQMEFPTENEVLVRLNELVRRHPEAELLVLSEYTFDGLVPKKVKDWCRAHRRYLIAGGKEPLPGGNFLNTTFVVSPEGEIVFKQVKCVPIQFFKDGLPATEQRVWDSSWGKIGICVCYDLSYSRVTDPLIRSGARALIVPTMDVADWGQREHELHARVAPLRAAEYRVPIFRLASSGISQAVDRGGQVLARAPFPGDGAIISGKLDIGAPGTLPLDRWLAPFATAVTGFTIIFFVATALRPRRQRHRSCAPSGGESG